MSFFSRILFVLLVFITSCAQPQKEGEGADIGLKAPNITGSLPDGTVFNLHDLQGEFVVLDFWGTWCGPCLREAPDLVQLQADFADRIQVVSVALEKTNDGRSETVAERLGFTWPYRLTEEISFVMLSETAGKYGVSDIPSTFLIDEKGYILLARSSVKEIRSYLLAGE